MAISHQYIFNFLFLKKVVLQYILKIILLWLCDICIKSCYIYSKLILYQKFAKITNYIYKKIELLIYNLYSQKTQKLFKD